MNLDRNMESCRVSCVIAAVFLLAQADLVSARVCVLGTEPDSSAGGMVRAVMPPGDPCTCTVIVPGGHNMYAPPRPDPPTYIEVRHLIAADAGEIRRLFNCVAGNTPNNEPSSTETADETSPNGDINVQESTPIDATAEKSTSLADTTAQESTLDTTSQVLTTETNDQASTTATAQDTKTLADTHTYVDCQEILDAGHTTSGVYTIYLNTVHIPVYCSMEGSLGYIMFQKRIDGSVSFNRNWQEYADGFGDVAGEFWLGNEKLKKLTAAGTWELLITMKNFAGGVATVKYGQFSITDPNYKLYVHSFTEVTSSPGDSLLEHSGMQFSTVDADNDEKNDNCAAESESGWWFKDCEPQSNLNGPFSSTETVVKYGGIQWQSWLSKKESLKECAMKIRRTA